MSNINYQEIAKLAGIYINPRHPIMKLKMLGKDNINIIAYDSLANFYESSITKALSTYNIEYSIDEARLVIMAAIYG